MLALALLFSGCDSDPAAALPPVEVGSITICIDGVSNPEMGDEGLDYSGTLTAAEPGDCGYTLTVDGGDGTSHTLGFDAFDADANALTLDLSGSIGTLVTFGFRTGGGAMIPISGVFVTDDAGLLLAADEGAGAGALEGEAVPGLAVTAGTETVAGTVGKCGGDLGSTVVFEGDDTLELTPVEEGILTVSGAEMKATALASTRYEPGTTCDLSDQPSYLMWMVSRE